MRFLILALAMSTSCSAVAAAPVDYSIPTPHTYGPAADYVTLMFKNMSGGHRTLDIGSKAFDLPCGHILTLRVRVGALVNVSSDQSANPPKLLLQASRAEASRLIGVR